MTETSPEVTWTCGPIASTTPAPSFWKISPQELAKLEACPYSPLIPATELRASSIASSTNEPVLPIAVVLTSTVSSLPEMACT